MTHAKLIETMTNPRFYPHGPEKVDLIQTHISFIFIAGDYVYKVKKAVNFGFLDFSTLEKREYYCREELRLNRRLAPSIYLEVLGISENEQGDLAWGNGGPVVDYCVKMKKLPQDRMLKQLLAEGKAGDAVMMEIAQKLAAFHNAADTGGKIDECGGIETIRFNHDENFAQTARYIRDTIRPHQYEFIKAYIYGFMDKHGALLSDRVAAHKIRDCHGDLHLEHICVAADGIAVFDCIEFNERFRYADVAAEVAFLAMDLDFNGYAHLAETFVSAYVAATDDLAIPTLLNFYKCYYAYVRGKVTSFRLDDQAVSREDKQDARKTARKYFDLAYTYAARLETPTLILMAGLMGTGKSALGRRIALHIGAHMIRTDVLRKEMLEIEPSERHPDAFGKGIYSDDMSQRTYDKALEAAREKLCEGKSVVIDASFKKRAERRRACETAKILDRPFFIVECRCPDAVVKERLERRAKNKAEASDGRWEIYAAQKKDFDEITEFPDSVHAVIDTSQTLQECSHQVLEHIKKQV
ncbi:MAG: AAA family ATPase [Deltaproteobacteria bacterium]|nr:AAA family ATPase [Deltaproteobacteria bacterium]